MKKEYDFSQAIPNPYAKSLKNTVTICIDDDNLDYFQHLADETGLSSQTLINLFLRDCVKKQRKPEITWHDPIQAA